MKTQLSGIGSALPPGSLNQIDAASAADRLRQFDEGQAAAKRLQLLTVLYRRSGVQTRHSVLLRDGDEHPVDRQTFYVPTQNQDDRGPRTSDRMRRYESEAPELAAKASMAAIEAAKVSIDSIRHLVTVSCSGFNSPGFDLELYPRLGLAESVSRTHVGYMGCHGALNGLRVASAYASCQPGERVLLCAVELCTLHHQYTDDPQEIVANSLFADGAAAVIVEALPPDASQSRLNTHDLASDSRPWTLVKQASVVLPNSQEMMSWRIGDHGFQMTLSPQVPELIQSTLKLWIDGWLSSAGLSIADIQSWAVHPGGPRILQATSQALGLPEEALEVSREVLRDCGNMSSPTILFILERLQRCGARGPCVALAFGPGLVVEAALLA